MSMKDPMGDRMKANYENRTRICLPRRSYTVIRIDGKAFHTYTKGLQRPFDPKLIADMDATAAYLCKNIMGAKFGFVQSDEISILLTDFAEIGTEAWFDNNLQKMCSVSASLATACFNELRPGKIALFDSRVFQIPQKAEVENYFIWRQNDTVRNSISSVAQSMYSAKQLHAKTTDMMQEMIFQKGTNWNDFPVGQKRGRLIVKETYEKQPDESEPKATTSIRTRWVAIDPPIFTQDRFVLQNLIPTNQ